MKKDKKIYACYCRVSTRKDEQLDSLEKQMEYFKDLSKKQDFEIYEIYYDEGLTGSQTEKRDGYNKMMKDAEDGKFEIILVKDITRIMRNVKLFLGMYDNLIDWGVNLTFSNYGNMNIKTADKTYLTMLASFAEDEGRRLGDKVRFGKQMTAKKGRVPNFVYGYERIDNYTLKAIPEEEEVVKRVFDYYTEDKMGTGKIAGILNREGILTKKTKGTWTQTTVVHMLRNRLYVGEVINNMSRNVGYPKTKRIQLPESEWIIVKREKFRIISDEQFAKAEEILEDRKGTFKLTNKRESYKYTFSTLIKCGDCEKDGKSYSFRRMARRYSDAGNKKVWWCCSRRNAEGVGACVNNLRVNDNELSEALILFFKQRFINNRDSFTREVVKSLEKMINEKNKMEGAVDNPKDVAKKINKIREELKELTLLKIKKDIDEEMYEEISNEYNKELRGLNISLANLRNMQVIEKPEIERFVNRFLDNMDNIINDGHLKNEDLKKIIEYIKVYHDGTTLIKFRMDTQGKLDLGEIPLMIKTYEGEVETEAFEGTNYRFINVKIEEIDKVLSRKSLKSNVDPTTPLTENLPYSGEHMELFSDLYFSINVS